MPKQTPKFATLLNTYQQALSTATDEKADLDKQAETYRLAEEALNVARMNLTNAMKQFGINSIREYSFEEDYLFLTADGNLEPRKIVTAADAHKKAKSAAA